MSSSIHERTHHRSSSKEALLIERTHDKAKCPALVIASVRAYAFSSWTVCSSCGRSRNDFLRPPEETNSGLSKDNCMGCHASTGGDSSGDNGVFGFRDPVAGTEQIGHVVPIVQDSQARLGISMESTTFCQPFNNSSNVLNCMPQGQVKRINPAMAWPVSPHTLGHPRN